MTRPFNFLQAYKEYTREAESPDSYHLWVGLSTIASVVRRQVWVDQKLYLLYPNLYIVLVGPPGRTAKTTAIRLSQRLLKNVESVTFGPDSLTREELIQTMARAGGAGKTSAITLHSSEMSSLIEPSGIKMIQFLTDIYDGEGIWKYATKQSGKSTIHNPILNVLCGTVPDYIANDLPVSVIGSGFSARTIFVFEDEPRFANPHPDEVDPELTKALIAELQHIATLGGEFRWTPGAWELYEKQYEKILFSMPEDYRLEDFHFRKKIHILKLAMLLAISERDDLTITEVDLETAWAILDELEVNMPRVFSAVGKYEYASDLERIIAQVAAAGEAGLSVTEIFFRNRAVGDAETLGKILVTAEKGGMIQREWDAKIKADRYRAI